MIKQRSGKTMRLSTVCLALLLLVLASSCAGPGAQPVTQPTTQPTAQSATQASAQPTTQVANRAGLVVVYDQDRVSQTCVSFSETELPGAELLRRGVGSDLVIGSTAPGIGEAICKIDDVGCTYPGEQCFCQCLGTPCVYWNYWYWKDSDWVYSGRGAGNRVVRSGDIDAWVWGDGQTKPPPPTEARCAESPSATGS